MVSIDFGSKWQEEPDDRLWVDIDGEGKHNDKKVLPSSLAESRLYSLQQSVSTSRILYRLHCYYHTLLMNKTESLHICQLAFKLYFLSENLLFALI